MLEPSPEAGATGVRHPHPESCVTGGSLNLLSDPAVPVPASVALPVAFSQASGFGIAVPIVRSSVDAAT